MDTGRPIRRVALAALVGAGLIATLALAAPGAPVLRSATASQRHVLVVFTIGDLRPWEVEVATSAATEASGGFVPKNVRLREVIRAKPDPSTGLVRWRTRATLPARTYYVRVSAIETDGVTDCPPQQRNCLVHWSNTGRVLIR